MNRTAKLFTKDVKNEIAIMLVAELILKSLVPALSMAVFGVPIPPKIVEILLETIKKPSTII